VGADKILGGFYRKLYALQGHRNTFYTGAALSKHSTNGVWQYTEDLLTQKVLKAL
jgi:hypothetical protein